MPSPTAKYRSINSSTSIIRKWGNSLGIRISSEIAKKLNLENGSQVVLNIENDKLVISPTFPEADNHLALRAHFLKLRKQASEFSGSLHEEQFGNASGDEVI